MTIALDRDVQDFLNEQVRSGACTDAGALINDVIRSICEQQRLPCSWTPELEAWLLEAADKPVTALAREDFDGIRARVQVRVPRAAA